MDYKSNREIIAWSGNAIFWTAQISQIVHTFRIKETKDISLTLQILWVIGNSMYTTFGYLDNSMSMFIGNLFSLIFTLIQIGQRIYYNNRNQRSVYETIN